MVPKIENLGATFKLGEGPHWDVKNQCLYFVSVLEHKIVRYMPSTKLFSSASLGNHNVSIIIPVKGKENQFVVSIDRQLAVITWDGESENVSILEKIYEVDENTENVFNDGKCDSSGRLWCGTMGRAANSLDIPDGKGSLYSFQNKTVSCHRTKIGIANGIAFNKQLNKMYYIDSFARTVDQYDIDFEKGTLSNMQVVYKSESDDKLVLFDGMTIDTDGNLWIAVFNGCKIIKIDPRRPQTLLETIQLPAKEITSLTFGGPNLDELYVTSARAFSPPGPMDGALFRITGINATGCPADEIIL